MRRLLLLFLLAACKRSPSIAAEPTSRWLNPIPQGNALLAVYVDGQTIYAVGEAGTILLSRDGGGHFESLPSGVRETLTGITGDGGGLTVVGWNGLILTSTDGRTFRREKSPTTEDLHSVWANRLGRLFAAGANGTMLRSTNGGASWFTLDTGTRRTLRAVRGTEHDEIFACGDGGLLIASDDNAPVWTRRATDTEEDLRAIWVGRKAGAGTVLVAGGSALLRSFDHGVSFELLQAPAHLLALGGGDHDVVAAGAGGALFRSGNAGRAFTPLPSASEQPLLAVAPFGKGAVAAGGFGSLIVNDRQAAPGLRRQLLGVAGARGHLYAVGVDGTLLHAPPGGALTPLDTGIAGALTAVAASEAQVVAVGAGGTLLVGSPGERLLPVPSGTERLLRGVALRGERIVAVGEAGTVVDSRDGGKSFTAKPQGDADLAAVWLDERGVVIAAGARGTLWRDGEPLASPTTEDLRALSGAADGLVAVGARGTLLVSRDGKRFERLDAKTTADLTAVSGGPSDALIAGERGILLRLPGPTPEDSGTTNALTAIWRGEGRTLVVGAGGTVLSL